MKAKSASLIWGIILILIAGMLLANALGFVKFDAFSGTFWAVLFGVASLFFLIVYFLSGIRQWGWLFPAFICAALGLTIGLAEAKIVGSFLGTPILAAVALPFYIGFLLNRQSWGLLIPAWALTVFAFIPLLADRVDGNLIGAGIQFAIAIPFLVVYLLNRKHWWALIPAWIMFIVGLVTLLSDRVDGDLIGALFLYAAALPFLVVYLLNRTRRWALIPAAALGVIGTFPLLATLFSEEAMGAAVMFLFSLPFFVVYFWSRNNWWALIPAGIFGSIGVVVVLSMFIPGNQPIFDGIMTGIVLLGFGLTFGVLWLRRKTQPTDWARYPAAGLLTAAVLAAILGKNVDILWPLVILGVGIALLATGFIKPKQKDQIDPPAEQK